MININKVLRQIIAIELEELSGDIKKELIAQGHRLTGRLVESTEVVNDGKGVGIKMNFYIQYVNDGVKSVNIPFTRGSGRKSSKYIDALMDYFRKRGLGPEDSKRAAFATAMKHKKEGIPTKASKRFSSTGKRTGAVDIAIKRNENKIETNIENKINEKVLATVDLSFNQLLKAA